MYIYRQSTSLGNSKFLFPASVVIRFPFDIRSLGESLARELVSLYSWQRSVLPRRRRRRKKREKGGGRALGKKMLALQLKCRVMPFSQQSKFFFFFFSIYTRLPSESKSITLQPRAREIRIREIDNIIEQDTCQGE